MRTKLLFTNFLLGCVYTPLFATTIALYNNSTYELIASIEDAQGVKVGNIELTPGQNYIWNSEMGSFDKMTNKAYTPYTVQWLCRSSRPYDYSDPKKNKDKKNKKKSPSYISIYGTWPNVGPGATITALGSPSGNHSCTVKKGSKKASSKSTSGKYTNEGTNQWSNDGGLTWTNDGGFGWEDNDGGSDLNPGKND